MPLFVPSDQFLPLRPEAAEFVQVCRTLLSDLEVWRSVRETETGTAPVDLLSLRLGELGVLSARQTAAADGGLDLREAAAIMSALGETMTPLPVADALAVGPVLAELDSEFAEAVAAGEATVGAVLPTGARTGIVAGPRLPDAVVVLADEAAELFRSPGEHAVETDCVDPSRMLFTMAFDGRQPSARVATDAEALRGIRLGLSALLAAEAVGSARAALELTVQYSRDRVQFGRAIGSFQAVKHALADTWCEVELADTAVLAAAEHVDRAPAAAATETYVAVACWSAVQALQSAAERAVHIHGGMGIAWESGIQSFVRRALIVRRLLDPDRRCEAIVLQQLRAQKGSVSWDE